MDHGSTDAGAGYTYEAGETSDAAALRDATPDQKATEPDASDAAALTCPTTPPPGTSTCCGPIPCNGTVAQCTPTTCTNCQNDCNVGQTCCLDKNGNFAGCSVACP